jgi:hypothetical protein
MSKHMKQITISLALLFCFSSSQAKTNDEIYASLPALELPQLDPDIIAFGDSLQFVAGTAQGLFQAIDGPGDSGNFTLSLDASYNWYQERQRWALTLTANGNFDLATNIATNPGTTFDMTIGMNAAALDGRFYFEENAAVPVFVHGSFALQDLAVQFERVVGPVDWRDSFHSQLALAGGVGVGRMYNISPRLRLLKLEKMLLEEGAISGALPKDVAEKIMLTWYVLRDKLGSFEHFAHTMKILKDSQLLLQEPSIEAAYKFLNIFGDGLLNNRRIGYTLRMTFLFWHDFRHDINSNETDTEHLGLSLTYNHVFNIDFDAAIEINPQMLFSFRDEDNAFIGGRAVINLPAEFTRYIYDDVYNMIGRLGAGMSLGFTFEPDTSFVRLFGHYDFAIQRGRFYSIDSWVELNDDNRFAFFIGLSYNWGRAAAYFTTYQPLEQQLPWWPL